MPTSRLLIFPPHRRLLSTLSNALRTSLRSLPHPVIILTTTSPSPPSTATTTTTTTTATTPGHGITLSSLTCLSLTPHPLITFNIKTPSRTSSGIHSHPTGAFTIHILRSTQHCAHLANSFAQLAAGVDKAPPWSALSTDVELHPHTGVPMLAAAEGVLARWRCEKYRVLQVEDHEIWVGRVLEVESVGEEGEMGLMYANRRFRAVGGEVVPEFMRPGQEVKVGEEEEEEEWRDS